MKIRTLLLDPFIGNFLAFFIGATFICLGTYTNGDYGVIDGPTPIMVGVFCCCYWMIRIHAYRESIRIKEKKVINHTERFIIRIAIALFIGLFVHFLSTGVNSHSLMIAIACAFYIGGIFWLIFDVMLNVDRGLEPFYISNWYRTSKLDKLFFRDPRIWLISKVMVFILSAWTYGWALNNF